MNKIIKSFFLIIFIALSLFITSSNKLCAESLINDVSPSTDYVLLAQGFNEGFETEIGKDIIGSKKKAETESSDLRGEKSIVPTRDDLITFSARNITVKDAFATLARISGKSISVGSDIRDDEKIAVIEIKEQPFEEAFYSLVDASMVNFTRAGDSFTVIKGGSNRQIMIFDLSTTAVNKDLPLLERKSDLSYDNQDLATLLKDIANKYGIDIVLTAVPTERVSARVRGVNVEEALDLVLSGTSFDYTRVGDDGDRFVIYNRLNKNFTIGQTSRLFQLMNLEAMDVQALLPVQIRANVRISNDQNAIIADGSPNDLMRLKEFLEEIDRPLPQVELEVKLIEVAKNAGVDIMLFPTQADGGFAIGHTSGIASFPTVSEATDDAAASLVKSLIPNRGFKINFDDKKWNIFQDQLRFLETMNLARVRAYPKLTSLSGRTAMINIDTDTNLVLGSATGQAGSIAVSSQQLQRITAGTALSITPVVGTGGLISTMIQIEVSDNSGETTSQNGVSIPQTTTRRRISAEVQVRDGETVGIGGLIVDNDSLSNDGAIPVLSRLPIIGEYLGNRSKNKSQSELIVLITPRIRNIPENSVASTNSNAPITNVNAPIPGGG